MKKIFMAYRFLRERVLALRNTCIALYLKNKITLSLKEAINKCGRRDESHEYHVSVARGHLCRNPATSFCTCRCMM